MLRTVFSALAKRGISWKGETGTPFFSIKKEIKIRISA
jgi:hypothetical protein